MIKTAAMVGIGFLGLIGIGAAGNSLAFPNETVTFVGYVWGVIVGAIIALE